MATDMSVRDTFQVRAPRSTEGSIFKLDKTPCCDQNILGEALKAKSPGGVSPSVGSHWC